VDLKALADRKDPVVWLERLVLLENVVLKAPPVPMEFPVKLEILDRWDLRVDRVA